MAANLHLIGMWNVFPVEGMGDINQHLWSHNLLDLFLLV
jgi:hypothetical protein